MILALATALSLAAGPAPATKPEPSPDVRDPRAEVKPFTVSPTLSMETDGRIFSNQAEGESGFVLRRLRLGAHLSVSDWAEVVGRLEYLPDADQHVGVFDAYVEVAPTRDLRASFGFRKTPLFASARDEPIEALSIPELALPVRTFWPGRDLGLEVHRIATLAVPVEGFLRVGNGSQSAAGNDDLNLSYEARVDVACGRALPSRPDAARGFRFGIGGHHEWIGQERAGLTGYTAGSVLFWRPATMFGNRDIAEAHAAAWLGPWTLRAEGAYAREERSANPSGNPDAPRTLYAPLHSVGAFAEASYLLFGPSRVPGNWPNPTADWTDWRHGGLELAARAEWVKLGQGDPRRVPPGGALGGSAAVRWWTTRWLAASVAAYWLQYDALPPIPDAQLSALTLLARVAVVLY